MTKAKQIEEDTPKVFIEPGEEFQVRYGNDKRATVVCLAGSAKRKLSGILSAILKAEKSGDPIKILEAVDLVYTAVEMVMPNATKDFMESIDEQFASQIAFNAYGKQSVGESDKKKSE